jgi:hypothetical protein
MNSKSLLKISLLLLSLMVFFASCVKEGPMGLSGEDGKDGVAGADGKDANATCLTCHLETNMKAIEAQYESSDKGERAGRTGKYCAKCHTTEGFEETLTQGTFFVRNEMLNGTKISCTACHKHSGFDFGTDPIAKILRTTAPVYLNHDNYNLTTNAYVATKATDYGSVNNLCGTCHQNRATTVETYTDPNNPVKPVTTGVKFTQQSYFPIANSGTITQNTLVKFRTGTNFSIHESSPQSDNLLSKGGYEYAGKTYTRKTSHTTSKCTDCHFNKYDATTSTGGHTLRVNLKDPACVTCHDLSTKIPQTLTTINAKLIELGDLLAAKKIFKKTSSTSASALNGFTYSAQPSHDFYGTLLPTTNSAPATYALTLSSKNLPSTTTGLLVYNSEVTWAADTDFANRIGREWTYGELGAAYNFNYVNQIATPANRGLHNTIYALELLQSSIDYLK